MTGAAPRLGLSADKHSNVVNSLKDRVKFQEERATAKYFGVEQPPEGGDHDNFIRTLMTGLNKSKNEKQLQDAVSNAMDMLPDVNVPEECKKPPNREDMFFLRLLPSFVGVRLYTTKEKDTKSILNLIGTKYSPEGVLDRTIPAMNEAEPGLFIKSSSRPDAVGTIVTQRGPSREAVDQDIIFAEIKNDNNYCTKHAYSQESCYLMLLLYWYKVLLGIDVEKVYGFFLCGPRCKNTKSLKRFLDGKPREPEYAIGLIELSAPAMIGQLHTIKCYKMFCSLTDNTGISYLARFLSSNTWNKIRGKPRITDPIPAYFIAPKGFHERVKVAEKANLWSLVPNGTSAIVLRCEGRKGVYDALNNVGDKLGKIALDAWGKFLKKKKNIKARFYLKVVTASTSGNAYQFAAVTGSERINKLWGTYPVDAVNGRLSYAVLMYEVGKPLTEKDMFTLNDFRKKYSELWNETIAIEQATELCHGDIGVHNLLLDINQHFVLIDWDEASFIPLARDPGNDIDARMRHPEIFRSESSKALYTNIQLALLYFRLECKYCQNPDGHWNPETARVENRAGLDVLEKYREFMKMDPDHHDELEETITLAAQDLVDVAREKLDLS